MLRTAIASSPRSGGNLLRTTRSLGSLRSLAAAQQPQQQQQSAIVPPVPSRSLVSSVLLSRDAYDRQNVSQLKVELKSRGLTTSGRRNDLVTRLLNDDAKRSGSGLVLDDVAAKKPSSRRGKASLASLRGKDGGKKSPVASSGTPTNAVANDPSSTAKSSSPSAPPSPSPKTEASLPTSSGAPIVGSGATIPHPPEIKPGDAVSPSLEVSDGAVKAPQKLPSASGPPGVPPQKEPAHPETFKVFIPYEEPAEIPGPDIPIVTMYPNRKTEPNRDDPTPAPVSSPKLVRASEDSAVSHNLETDDSGIIGSVGASEEEPVSLAEAARAAKEDLSVQAGSLLKSIDSLRSGASDATSSIVNDIKGAVEAASGVDPSKVQETVSKSLSLEGQADKKEDGKRPLNADEKRGLYLLGGLLFGGFLAGGYGKPKKEKH